MLALLKFLDGPWDVAKRYLREDLDHIEAAVNQRWGKTFGDGNNLQAGAILGDATPATRYVANTGPANAPKWDTVNLVNGVSGRLAYSHLPAATAPTVVIGAKVAGDFSQQSLAGMGFWTPLTNGDVVNPELIYAGGEAIMMFIPT